mmetsp:Transcript_50840/g.108320  ORF Transcript_50840/g.108320 Transcript_50840/m.108320 type:complete len:219 (+) Transcript_50840:447-1103(+)
MDVGPDDRVGGHSDLEVVSPARLDRAAYADGAGASDHLKFLPRSDFVRDLHAKHLRRTGPLAGDGVRPGPGQGGCRTAAGGGRRGRSGGYRAPRYRRVGSGDDPAVRHQRRRGSRGGEYRTPRDRVVALVQRRRGAGGRRRRPRRRPSSVAVLIRRDGRGGAGCAAVAGGGVSASTGVRSNGVAAGGGGGGSHGGCVVLILIPKPKLFQTCTKMSQLR